MTRLKITLGIIWGLMRENPVKTIALILFISSSTWWWNSERDNDHYKWEVVQNIDMGDGEGYFVTQNHSDEDDELDYKLKKVQSWYTKVEEDDKVFYTYDTTSISVSTGVSCFLSIVFLIVVIGGHWEDGYFEGWGYKNVRKEVYVKNIEKIRDGSTFFYVINGKVIKEVEVDYNYAHDNPLAYHVVRDLVTSYLASPKLYDDYKGTKSERREDRLGKILDVLNEDQ